MVHRITQLGPQQQLHARTRGSRARWAARGYRGWGRGSLRRRGIVLALASRGFPLRHPMIYCLHLVSVERVEKGVWQFLGGQRGVGGA